MLNLQHVHGVSKCLKKCSVILNTKQIAAFILALPVHVRSVHTSIVSCCLYEKKYNKDNMSQRITVHIPEQGQSSFKQAHFTQCLVDYFEPGNKDGITVVTARLDDNKLHLESDTNTHLPLTPMKHPSFCPVYGLSSVDHEALPQETLTRGIDCGAAVILETGDGKVLLTRRGDNLRTFPGIWVPPGGHIEADETLAEAGLRELREETGLNITPDMCYMDVRVLALWESVYPPRLSLGPPKRHHAVVYLYAKLKPEITSTILHSKIKIDPSEVGASAWFDRSKVEAIVSVKEGEGQTNSQAQELSNVKFSAFILNDAGQQVEGELEFRDLLKSQPDSKDQRGRVSTGTKFALEQWLAWSSVSTQVQVPVILPVSV